MRTMRILLLLILGLLVLSPSTFLASDLQPQDSEAEPILEQADIVSLAGPWEFYWSQLLTPVDFRQEALPQPAQIEVPSSWHEQTLGLQTNNGKPLPRFGYATYRKIISIPDEHIGNTMAMFFESIGSSYKVWVNGKLLESIGRVGKTATAETPRIRMNLVYFTPTNDSVEIVMQVSNYSFRDSGMFGEAKMSSANDITYLVFKRFLLKDLLIIGALSMIGIYHFIVFFSGRRAPDVFFMGALCLTTALRTLFLNKFLTFSIFPGISWEWAMQLHFVMRILGVLCYISLVRAFYPKEVHRFMHWASIVISLLFLLQVMVTPPEMFTLTMPVQTMTTVALLFYYAIYVGIVTAKRKREGALLNMMGLCLLIMAIINDTWLYAKGTNTWELLPVTLTFFLMLQGIIISRRYSRITKQNSDLAQSLQQLNHQLEDTVTERTKELRQKNKKLSMQDEQRSRLMANIAHDMGSPILGVQSSLHILAVEELTKKDEKTLVELMLRKVNYVKHLIDDLFQLAKLESRQSNFQWEIVTVTDFETEIEERFRGLLKETENRMNVVRSEGVEISGAPAKVRVDRYQLFRVLQNLMDNALKFSRGQQTEIVFRSVVQVAGDGSQRRQEWLVEIVDDGIGIASDQLPRLFERFYTRNPGVPEGSGLGLAIVKETIELHGGTVGVRSELGEGSTFYFVLPCVSQVES